jgi:hypothetical protein
MSSGAALTFHVLSGTQRVPSSARSSAFLKRDRWDDWGKYCTQFFLTFVDDQGNVHDIGNLKIGQQGLRPSNSDAATPGQSRAPAIPDQFEALGQEFFSLGQGEDYYENLKKHDEVIRNLILACLADVAKDIPRWEANKSEEVMTESLLRAVTSTTVEGQYRRMANGGAKLTSFRFSYSPPKRDGDGSTPFELNFRVEPDTLPPTNVHVLIGRNGVGKTRLLSLMSKALVASRAAAAQAGKFTWQRSSFGFISNEFANLVCVSFSAFDDAETLPLKADAEQTLSYSYIGLRRTASEGSKISRSKSPTVLASEFISSLMYCQETIRKRRWISAMKILESDPMFSSARVIDWIDSDLSDIEHKAEALAIFRRLSSGHKIVLLSITKLVETVEEKTLVLIDEPEAHLHPPLLSAFVRALSALLLDRNGVAIVATHSPVVLQEVPKSCVSILNRIGSDANAVRPEIETFGENVSVLTREVFQLELAQAGFHSILYDASIRHQSYEAALSDFDNELGAEARAVLRAMFISKNGNA